jgi:hypothetical protein
MTGCPTLDDEEEVKLSGCRSLNGALVVSTAKSLYGSVPTTVAKYASPFQKVTVMLPNESTTWKLVTTK